MRQRKQGWDQENMKEHRLRDLLIIRREPEFRLLVLALVACSLIAMNARWLVNRGFFGRELSVSQNDAEPFSPYDEEFSHHQDGDEEAELIDADALMDELEDENPLEGNPYFENLDKLEKEVSFWAHDLESSVSMFGREKTFNLNFEIYAQAFEQEGMQVHRLRSRSGKDVSGLSFKDIKAIDDPAVSCFMFTTSSCLHDMKSHLALKPYQRFDRITYLRQTVWDKGNLCKTLKTFTKESSLFDEITFRCWVTPGDFKPVFAYSREHPEESYVVKPLAEGQGRGIRVVDGLRGLQTIGGQTMHLVQQYLPNPHLINGFKWDIRAYVLVSSAVPLRVYMHRRGLVRFASERFQAGAKKGGGKAQFLTNTSFNKKFMSAENVTSLLTWSFDDLEKHLSSSKYHELMERIKSATSIAFLSAHQRWVQIHSEMKTSCDNCYQLFGVDSIVDENMHPRIIEINARPSLRRTGADSNHYSTTKNHIVTDMIRLIFNKDSSSAELARYLSKIDKNLLSQLGRREKIAALRFLSECKNLGGWEPVYPNLHFVTKHDEFFAMQDYVPEATLALHQILKEISQSDALCGKRPIGKT